jgi:hypothetical protein
LSPCKGKGKDNNSLLRWVHIYTSAYLHCRKNHTHRNKPSQPKIDKPMQSVLLYKNAQVVKRQTRHVQVVVPLRA